MVRDEFPNYDLFAYIKTPSASLPPTFSSHTTPRTKKFSHTRVCRSLFSKSQSLRLYKDRLCLASSYLLLTHNSSKPKTQSCSRMASPSSKKLKAPPYGALALPITKRPQTMERSPPGNCRKQVHDTTMEMNSVCELLLLERFGVMELFLWEFGKAMGKAAWCRERIGKNTNDVTHGAALPPKKRSMSKSVTKVPDFIAMYRSAYLKFPNITREKGYGSHGSQTLENGCSHSYAPSHYLFSRPSSTSLLHLHLVLQPENHDNSKLWSAGFFRKAKRLWAYGARHGLAINQHSWLANIAPNS